MMGSGKSDKRSISVSSMACCLFVSSFFSRVFASLVLDFWVEDFFGLWVFRF